MCMRLAHYFSYFVKDIHMSPINPHFYSRQSFREQYSHSSSGVSIDLDTSMDTSKEAKMSLGIQTKFGSCNSVKSMKYVYKYMFININICL